MNQFAKMREKNGMSQEVVAKRLGIDRSAIAKWETGEAMPRVERLIQLSRLYGCTIDELLGIADMKSDNVDAFEEEKK